VSVDFDPPVSKPIKQIRAQAIARQSRHELHQILHNWFHNKSRSFTRLL
jgi:hypothetical protein